ncbi:unnamed protein product [Lathyrus oleraceus]
MEKLSHLILEAAESGKWVGIKVVRRGPSISHLMFAGKATTKKVYHVKDILDHLCNKSGQHVSIDKLEYSSRAIQLLGLEEDLPGCLAIRKPRSWECTWEFR